MHKYLGEFKPPVNNPYTGYSPQDWALTYIEAYSQIDGAHHKQWVLDQIARILKGTPVIVKVAKWEGGSDEYRFNTGEPSQEYMDWVIKDGDFEYEYDYDVGIAP